MPMTLTDYPKTQSWQTAIKLGSHIIALAEQLPEAEQQGLAQQLRQLMVELPGGIALDLVEGTRVRLPLALRLTAALELVERIYPALDAAPARAMLAELCDRLVSDRFTETTGGSPVAAVAIDLSRPEAAPASEQPESTPDAPAEPAGSIHVQPDSGQ
jgi:hypothetical protein